MHKWSYAFSNHNFVICDLLLPCTALLEQVRIPANAERQIADYQRAAPTPILAVADGVGL